MSSGGESEGNRSSPEIRVLKISQVDEGASRLLVNASSVGARASERRTILSALDIGAEELAGAKGTIDASCPLWLTCDTGTSDSRWLSWKDSSAEFAHAEGAINSD